MCLGAIYWSHVHRVFFGNTHRDAARVGFDDQFIYDEIRVATEARRIPMIQLLASEAAKAMVEWEHKQDKLAY
jgi:guanine deaminase